MQIIIKVRNLHEAIDIAADTDKNVLYIGSKKREQDVSRFVLRLLAIVSSWPEKLSNQSIVGGESYSVSIKENEKEKHYVGTNDFPANYYEFKTLIGEVLNARI